MFDVWDGCVYVCVGVYGWMCVCVDVRVQKGFLECLLRRRHEKLTHQVAARWKVNKHQSYRFNKKRLDLPLLFFKKKVKFLNF